MSVDEIKAAIAELSPEERRELVDSLTRPPKVISPELRGRIRQDSEEALADDRWISWEELKAEANTAG